MAHITGETGGGTITGGTAKAASNTISSRPFLLLLGQVVAVLIAAWLAGLSDDLGYIIIAFFVVLWLIFIMNRSDLIANWGAKLGLPQPNQKVVVQ